MFLKEKDQLNDVDREYSVKEVIELSEGCFGWEQFENFFKGEVHEVN
jgi:hypothetical protein